MTDIALIWKDGHGDIVQDGTDLLTDDSIETAVIISLFTDRRAEPGDALPDGSDNRRGWWGDTYSQTLIGSRLWLLSREKQLSSVLLRAEQYAAEALQWLLDDELAAAVSITATNPADGVLNLRIDITLADGSTLPPFNFNTILKA
ncbi:phage GP46 family protein [Rahnella contaminans]|uniref:phage GP46 family protein n=1 Tax=Rahnella contaminans TaxID=2703882 RepID=UPI003C2C8709